MNCYLGIDTRVVLLSTSIAPRHNTLQLTIAHDGATRVTLKKTEDGYTYTELGYLHELTLNLGVTTLLIRFIKCSCVSD